MKKKIKDLTLSEIHSICSDTDSCIYCSLYKAFVQKVEKTCVLNAYCTPKLIIESLGEEEVELPNEPEEDENEKTN